MDPTAAIPLLAPEQSRSSSKPTSPSAATWLENYIGQQTAGAAAALLVAFDEARDGGVNSGTRQQGGELVAELVKLRNFLIGRAPDFDSTARRRGVIMLREACNELSPATCEELVAAVLEIVARVIRQELN